LVVKGYQDVDVALRSRLTTGDGTEHRRMDDATRTQVIGVRP